MNRRSAILFIPVLALALSGGRAHAQRDVRIGDFFVRVRGDAGERIALVFPDSQSGHGALMWACGGEGDPPLLVALRQSDLDRAGARDVVWRFDDDAPDTTGFHATEGRGVWFAAGPDAERFTSRARTAAGLRLETRGDSASARPREFRYTLAGADSALARLECGSGTRRGAAGRATLARAADRPWVDSTGALTDAEPEEFPRVLNQSEFARMLHRNYPPRLRERGVGGRVDLRFRVLESGEVDSASIRVLRSTHPEFTEAAVGVVPHLQFRPARVYGRRVKVWIELPIQFSAPDPPASDRRRRG